MATGTGVPSPGFFFLNSGLCLAALDSVGGVRCEERHYEGKASVLRSPYKWVQSADTEGLSQVHGLGWAYLG